MIKDLFKSRDDIIFEQFTLVRDYIDWFDEVMFHSAALAEGKPFKLENRDAVVTYYISGLSSRAAAEKMRKGGE